MLVSDDPFIKNQVADHELNYKFARDIVIPNSKIFFDLCLDTWKVGSLTFFV